MKTRTMTVAMICPLRISAPIFLAAGCPNNVIATLFAVVLAFVSVAFVVEFEGAVALAEERVRLNNARWPLEGLAANHPAAPLPIAL